MPGEEARVSNVCQCSLSNVAGYVLILGWLVFNILVRTIIFCWFPVTPTYSHLGTVFCVNVDIC